MRVRALAATAVAAGAAALLPMARAQRQADPSSMNNPLLPSLAATAEAEGFDPAVLESITPTVQQLIADKAIPGAVALGTRHGNLVLNVTAGGGAFSWDQGEPIFRLFSMSKPVISILALALAEEGLVTLDDPISKFLPELGSPSVYQGTDAWGNVVARPASRCATVRELMTHTAGFSYGFNPKHPVDRAYVLAGFADMRDQPGADAFLRSLKDIPLIAEPNTTWQYSVAYDVLGVLLERAASRPLDAILRDYLTAPLQLPDTDFFVPPHKAHRLPVIDVELNDTPYALRPINENFRPPFFSGGAGLYASASDYLRIVQMLMNGGELDGVRILSPDAVKAMTRNQVPEPILPFHMGGWQGSAFGLGVAIAAPNEASPSRPVGEVSWGGFAGTNFFFAPASSTAVITMTQHAPMNGKLVGAVKPSFFTALQKGGGMPSSAGTAGHHKPTPALRGGRVD